MGLRLGWTDGEVVPEWPEAGGDEAGAGVDERKQLRTDLMRHRTVFTGWWERRGSEELRPDRVCRLHLGIRQRGTQDCELARTRKWAIQPPE